MISVYVSLIKKGARTLEQVPVGIRDQVKEALENENN